MVITSGVWQGWFSLLTPRQGQLCHLPQVERSGRGRSSFPHPCHSMEDGGLEGQFCGFHAFRVAHLSPNNRVSSSFLSPAVLKAVRIKASSYFLAGPDFSSVESLFFFKTTLYRLKEIIAKVMSIGFTQKIIFLRRELKYWQLIIIAIN